MKINKKKKKLNSKFLFIEEYLTILQKQIINL